MEVKNMVTPNQTQMNEFLEGDIDSPISMVNLLKFKEKAEYEDGRDTEMSGKEAYQIYAIEVQEHLKKVGAEMVFGGASNRHEIRRRSHEITTNKRNKIKNTPIEEMLIEIEGSIGINYNKIKDLNVKKGMFGTTLRMITPLKEIKIKINKNQIDEIEKIINKIKKSLNNSNKPTDKSKEQPKE